MSNIPFGDPKYADIEKAYRTLESADSELKKEFFAYWLDAMEGAVQKWQEGKAKDSALEPFHELAREGEASMAHLFRRLTGYVPHDFFEMHAASHSPMGRERIYTQEDNTFFAVFIEEMVTRKSSLTQAIELLYQLYAKGDMAPEGLRSQMRDAYNESQEIPDFWEKIGKDRLVHIFFVLLRHCDLSEKVPDGPARFAKAKKAYRSMISDVLEEMKEYRPTVEKYDEEAKKGTFNWIFQAIGRDYNDPIEFIHSNFARAVFEKFGEEEDEWRRKRYIRSQAFFDLYHSTKFFKEMNGR